MGKHITINGRKIGEGEPAYIIAEMSGNHNQDFDKAVRIVEAAKEAGADAIKLQTYTPDTLTIDCDKEHFLIKGTLWEGRNLYDLYGEAYTPWDWQPKLKDVADKLGLSIFSTPFDESAIDFLEEMNVPAYKVASFESVHLPLLRKLAETGKPVIMSTGLSTLEEIEESVRTLRDAGNSAIALLKCTSAYPAQPEDMNLMTIPDLAEKFGLPIGLSDHTLGVSVPIASIALGACIIEKHFTLSRKDSGPDSDFSLEPHEFKEMADAVRVAEKALGTVVYEISEKEHESRMFRRSLFIVRNMKEGEAFTESNIRVIRPGMGMHPRYLEEIMGMRASVDIERGTPLDWDLIKG